MQDPVQASKQNDSSKASNKSLKERIVRSKVGLALLLDSEESTFRSSSAFFPFEEFRSIPKLPHALKAPTKLVGCWIPPQTAKSRYYQPPFRMSRDAHL